MKLLSAGFCIFIVLVNSSAKKLPSFIEKCKPDYPEINKCLIQRTEDLKPYLIKGIPEMKIPSIKPLRISKIELDTGTQSSSGLKASFNDIRVDGASDFKVTSLDFDLKNNKIDMSIYIPKLRIRSTYNFIGRILILDLSSSGPADGNITEIVAVTHCNTTVVTKNGKHYLDVSDNKATISYAKPSVHFDDLFKGNEELTESTNQIINENAGEVLKEVKPLIDETIHSFFDSIIFRIFEEYSLEELFA